MVNQSPDHTSIPVNLFEVLLDLHPRSVHQSISKVQSSPILQLYTKKYIPPLPTSSPLSCASHSVTSYTKTRRIREKQQRTAVQPTPKTMHLKPTPSMSDLKPITVLPQEVNRRQERSIPKPSKGRLSAYVRLCVQFQPREP
jgi:hypothetical protein